VKQVKLFAVPVSGGAETLIYDGKWVTTAAGCLFFTGGTLEISQPLMEDIDAGLLELRVEAETSEPMTSLQVGGHFFPLLNMQFQSPILWDGIIPENAFAAAITNNTLLEEFVFSGTDLNGNPLFDLHTAHSPCTDIPQLQPNCSWAPAFTSNSRQVHVLERKCLQVDFDLNMEGGNIRALITGGTGPYTFSWRPEGHATVIGTEQNLLGVDPGRYCVSITDAAGCMVQACVTLCQPIDEVINQTVEITPPCPGSAGGGTVCLYAGTGLPLSYAWQDGSSGNCRSGLLAGNSYFVTITELACMQEFVYFTGPLAPVNPVSVALSSSSAACPNGGTNGRLQVTASGGRAPYSYVWNNGTTGALNTGLSAGACHSVTVTDACGQTTVQCFNLPVYTAVAHTWLNSHPTACVNGTNGRIQLSLSGGVTPMTFQWANTNGNIPQPIPSASLNNIGTGTYWVTVTDACGSPTSGGPFVVGTNYTPMAISGSNISAACGTAATGSIIFTRTGGRAPFDFNWSGPNGEMPSTDIPMVNNLPPGNYSVAITDACGETLDQSFTVGTISASTFIQINEADLTHICASGQTGAIDLSVSTSSGTLTFAWSTGATTEDVSGLSAGTHAVTISNGNCAMTNHFSIEQPEWELEGEVSPAFCKNENGMIDLKIEGNAGPLSFQWNTGATTEDIDDLEAGTYSVTATDAFGCSRIGGPFEVEEANSDLNISIVSVQGSTGSGTPDFPIDLHNGSINIQITGSFSPFSVQWSNGATTEDIDHLASGTYWVTVTDQRGCKKMMSITLPVCMNEDPIVTSYPWQITPALTAAGGSLGISVSGGNPPYLYSWQGPNGFSSAAMNLTGLTQPGEYCVTVTDYCNRTASICREIVTSCPKKNLHLEVDNDNGCLSEGDGEDITLNAISSFSNFSDYLYAEWSTGQTGLFLLGSGNYQPVSSVVWGNQSIYVTETGLYSITVTDDFGCQYDGQAQVSYSTIEALVALDIKLSDISSDFNGYDERVINEFYICTTCGYIFGGQTVELFDCSHSHHEHILFTPYISSGSSGNNNADNPCRRGGEILIQNGATNITRNVIPNSIATFVQEDDGGCGCLFPPEVLENMPPYLYNGIFSDHSELIYTEFQGVAGCSPDPGQDPFTNNTFDLGVFNYECECAVCIGLASNDNACTFSLLCIDEMGNSEINNIVVPGNIGYRKKSHLSMMVLGLGYGTIHCFIYQVCETAECALPPLEIHEFPGADCETLSETDLSFIAGGNHYYLSDIEYLPSCTDGFAGTPPQSFANSNAGVIKIEGNNAFSTAVFPNPATETLNIQMLSPEPTLANLQLYDMMGRKLFERTVEVAGKHIEQWDVLNTFVPGVYRLSIRDDRGNISTHSVVLTKK